MLEIEAKARVRDLSEIEKKLVELKAEFIKEEEQEDLYFNHACKDFSKTDEALRLRKVGEKTFLTYKGAKIEKLTKTREEYEVEVDNFNNAKKILEKLGFKEVAKVKKKRRYFRLKEYLISLDEVQKLGSFVEIEKKANEYDPKELIEFLKTLGAEDIERRSYLELLLLSESL